ncbi:MBL fold metallo-hydrolase [Spirochaetota bacterium]
MKSESILTFWGCRGSIASPGVHTIVYGGNTSCVSVEHENYMLIFDAGTGLRKLGQALIGRDDLATIKGSLFLTHTHWDHIQGLPFFYPVFLKENRFTIYGERKKEHSLEYVLAEQMQEPFFPLEMDDVFQADLDFHEIKVDQKMKIREDIHITPFRLNHPNASVGYLLQIDNIRLAYVTDHEHKVRQLTTNILEMVQGVDVLIHDAQYSRKEIENGKKGWGHSAWEDVIDLAIKAKVGQLFLYHHDPEITDEQLNERQLLAQQSFRQANIAREGLKIPLSKFD